MLRTGGLDAGDVPALERDAMAIKDAMRCIHRRPAWRGRLDEFRTYVEQRQIEHR
jgi:hypothetical protein